jgi:predicted hotdog family 3-hydroxylacyl-ACP dehydratase
MTSFIPTNLSKQDILRRVPHGARACLLDSVRAWDATSIICLAHAPTATHPYASAGAVASVVAVEYAAQATAVHGALIENSGSAREGALAALGDVELYSAALVGPLTVRAELISRSPAGCMYAFEVFDSDAPAARGRLTVALR